MELRGNKKNAPELQIFRVEEERRMVRFYVGSCALHPVAAGAVHAIITPAFILSVQIFYS